MNRIKCFTLIVLAAGSSTAFSAQDRTFHIQNSVRVGYDDNAYQLGDADKEGSAFLSDIVNISGKLVFSDRSDLELYWQPEFRYRFNAAPKVTSYQDFYGRFSHALSARTFFQISDRLRYQEQDGQSNVSGTLAKEDQNFLENDLMGALTLTLSKKGQLKLGGGYGFRTWDDDDYGEWRWDPAKPGGAGYVGGNNYDEFTVDGSYRRELRPNATHGLVGANYVNHEYAGSRGGYDSTTLYGGVDHNFNQNMLGNAQLGYSFSSIEGATSEDSTTPYLQAGLDYKITDRTSVNGTLGYSFYYAENSYFNAQDRLNIGLGAKHDLTGKITLSSTLSYTLSMFDSKYASEALESIGIEDYEEIYIRLSLRGSYQINRNNFVDVGYEISHRDVENEAAREYTRNRVDIGWRLRL